MNGITSNRNIKDDNQRVLHGPQKKVSYLVQKDETNNNNTAVVYKEVYYIPSRDSYPPEVQDLLWMRGKEYDTAVRRNTIEYISEGCTIDTVLEEEDFLPYNGQLVHPSHFLP
jgi:hypothetical protein